MFKLPHNCIHLMCYQSSAQNSKARLQQYWNHELPDIPAGFRKVRGTRDQIASICWIIEKARVAEKPLLLLYWLCQSLWLSVSQQSVRWEYQTILSASWEICMQVKKQQLELDMEQWTGSKSGKEYVKALYCHHASLTYMQSISCEMPSWTKHELKSRMLGEISITSDTQITSPLCQKVKN